MSVSEEHIFAAGQAGALAGAVSVAKAALLELARDGGVARLNALEALWLPKAEAATFDASPKEAAAAKDAHVGTVRALFIQARVALGNAE